MNESLKTLWTRFTPLVNRFNPRQRRNLIVTFLLGIISLGVILWIVTRPHYVTVLTGLDDKSLGQVQTELQTLKIPNEINGSSVLVPRSQATTAKVQLAEAGLPQSGYISYSSINSTFGMTQDQFNVQVLNVLQQSLDQTIESINGIENAQVHIVMPTQQLFVSQPTSTAKASVFVDVANGAQLSGVQVAGIQQLVAHSVQGLSTSDVSVVNQDGVTLSQTDTASGSDSLVPATEIQTRENLESQMQQQITNELNQIVGPGNAVATVYADVTFNQVKSTSHQYTVPPGQATGPIASQQTSNSTSTSGGGTGNTTGGVAGQSSTNPNLSTYATTSGGATGSSSNSSSNVTYDNSWVNTQTVNDPIQVNGYTVGVFLNAADKALTAQEVSQIQKFVTNAIGAQTGAHSTNSVFVSKVPFQNAASPGATPASGASKLYTFGGIGLGALALLGGVVLFLRRRRTEDSAVAAQPQAIEELADELNTKELSEEERRKLQLANLANQKPEEFANLVRTWLVGE